MHSQISTLLARSFFMGFSLTILAMLARFRVLVQQVSTASFSWNSSQVIYTQW